MMIMELQLAFKGTPPTFEFVNVGFDNTTARVKLEFLCWWQSGGLSKTHRCCFPLIIMTKIIYQLENGGVAVVHPQVEIDIDTLVETVVPDGADYEIVEDSVIPADNTFRNAWRKQGSTIIENLEAAKEIAH